METRKGPFGHFVCEKINDDSKVLNYAIEMINADTIGTLHSVYLNEFMGTKEFCFDYSGFIDINNSDISDINSLRMAIGDLFLSFSSMLNHLLPLSSLVIDSRYVFINQESNRLKLCFIPELVSTVDNLTLADLGSERLEKLLTNKIFKWALTNDEMSELIFAVNSNNIKLFNDIATHIKTSRITEKQEDNRTDYEYILTVIIMIIGLANALLFKYKYISELSIAIAIVIVANRIMRQVNRQKEEKQKEDEIIQKTRKNMLFDEEKSINTKANCLVLESTDPLEMNGGNHSVMSEKVTIGSDYFLSDIHLKNGTISPVHAEITYKDGAYIIRNLSDTNGTFLENIKIPYGMEYEIKNGQLLTLGELHYKIRIGFNK